MARPVVAVCLHDGYYGCGTGAGHSNRAFVEALTEHLADHVELLVLPIRIAESSPEHDLHWHAETVRILERVNARTIPLDNGTNGRTRWGAGLESFKTLVDHAAEVLIAETAGRPRLIIAFDAPFFGLAPHLPHDLVRELVLVPRSTAAIHTPSDGERIAWEREGLVAAAASGARIGSISSYMRHHLIADYALPESAFLDLPVGLRDSDWTRTPPPDHVLPERARAGFWLALGRAVPYKGFEDLLDALALLRRQEHRPPHLLLAAVSNKPEPTDYQRQLAARISREQLDATLITRYSPQVANLLPHPALRGVIVPSRAEPFGRIPLEAHAVGAAPVIATAVGGLAEQIIDGDTGILASPNDPTSLATALARAMALTEAQRQHMRATAMSFARTRNAGRTVRAFLKAVGSSLLPATSD